MSLKKIISFSLYGNQPNFQVGAIINCIEAKRLFPSWKCRFYTTDDDHICKQLEWLGAEVIRMDDWAEGKMFWRFLAVDDSDVCIVRDSDSVISELEVVPLNQWMNTNCQWHFMRHHAAHRSRLILGGMWGYRNISRPDKKITVDDDTKGGLISFKEKSMRSWIDDWLGPSSRNNTRKKQQDQDFLRWLYNFIIPEDTCRHGLVRFSAASRQPDSRPIPEKETRYTKFIGCRSFYHDSWNAGYLYQQR